jgi:hypothetical protein
MVPIYGPNYGGNFSPLGFLSAKETREKGQRQDNQKYKLLDKKEHYPL